ncbi:oxygen-independent coproporphyrinogen-3 oxidase [Dysgonomonas hofstadii]|uniref:Heme chaperone HemW n=1 Tax=Dysgonomonas hofstadii TaxID=637886 RepID=A0A840CYE6_9BACT|nr:radical SAM family heme chaperone HemW [Dysgonomonas hofstadii]MBB4037442.1 oxygen-independent coproporphyrinogen-3 oxidase [Dysgonomonas hofstadii]
MAGIYIHVPFCKTRCIYCDFYTRTDISPKEDYVNALCKEIELRNSYIGKETVNTIYFGGGTPSQLSYDNFLRIFDTLNNNFEIAGDAEITMEANPDDLNIRYLESIKNLPFNRLSIGIQSFDDKELQFLKRRHSAIQAKEAVKRSQDNGFENISIDLMYGLPNQTMEIWQKNLHEAINLNIQHISSYHLIYEQGTRLYRLFKHGNVKPVNEDLSVEMFSVMIDKLSDAGFEHYEISNFARNGLYSRHNSSYWLDAKYLGLGPAAHSYDGQNRAWNIASISKYIEGINMSVPKTEIEYLDKNTRYNDFILTGMRTMWGVDLLKLEKLFGSFMKEYALRNVQKYVDQGFATNQDNVLKLARNGIFISDGIMSDMMWVD